MPTRIEYEVFDPKKEKCKEMYMSGQGTLRQISDEVGVPLGTLSDWVYKGCGKEIGWKKEKEETELEIKKYSLERAKKELTGAYKNSSVALDNVLLRINDALVKNEYTPEQLPDIALKLSNTAKNMQFMLNMADGKSTQNIAIHSNINTDLNSALEKLRERGAIGHFENVEIIDENN